VAKPARINRRLVAAAVLAVALLFGLIISTGGGIPGFGSSNNSPSNAPPVNDATTPAVAPVSGHVTGGVTVHATHLGGAIWRFLYTIHNRGNTPIAGFQINGPTANLFHRVSRQGWSSFGSGICGRRLPGILIYWSTTTSSPTIIAPKQSGQFGFTVNTSGVAPVGYSLSWGSAAPEFGRTQGPAASTLPTNGSCKT